MFILFSSYLFLTFHGICIIFMSIGLVLREEAYLLDQSV